MESSSKREGDHITLRLFPRDHDLIQNLGRGRPGIPDRYTALTELAEYVADLDLEDIRDRERIAIRIRIPPVLREAIDRKAKKTGQPFLTILLAVAAEYRQRYPLIENG